VPDESLPLATRLWFAWLGFFKILFDADFAARAWAVREPHALPLAVKPEKPSKTETPASSALSVESESKKADATDHSEALQLLALLQREGRLVDFLEQDIATFPDADIGAAARVVHEGSRKALRAHVKLSPVRSEDEGAKITLPAGFDPGAVKLTGKVEGSAPFQGVLRHRGWRAISIELPTAVKGHDAHVICPAEVEL
jgi:hypothetical protein